MVKTEFYRTREDGVNLYRTYSDEGLMLHKVGTDEVYSDAIDIENSGYEYEETEELIGDEATETDYQNALEDLGVNFNEENDIE
jgi:hypothetical protein